MEHIYHQGCLDDLCGPYAVINAINRALPDDLDFDTVDEWYEKLFKKRDIKSKFYGGIRWDYLEEFATHAAKFINKKLKTGKIPVRIKLQKEKWPRERPISDLIGQVLNTGRACHVLLLCDSEDHWHYLALAKNREAKVAGQVEWIDSSEHFSDGPPDLIKSRSSFSVGGYRKQPRARYVIDRRHIVVTAEEVTA